MHGDYKTDIKVRCYGNELILGVLADVKMDRLHSLFRRYEIEYGMALCMHALIAPQMPLHRVCMVKIGLVPLEENSLENGNYAATQVQYFTKAGVRIRIVSILAH